MRSVPAGVQEHGICTPGCLERIYPDVLLRLNERTGAAAPNGPRPPGWLSGPPAGGRKRRNGEVGAGEPQGSRSEDVQESEGLIVALGNRGNRCAGTPWMEKGDAGNTGTRQRANTQDAAPEHVSPVTLCRLHSAGEVRVLTTGSLKGSSPICGRGFWGGTPTPTRRLRDYLPRLALRWTLADRFCAGFLCQTLTPPPVVPLGCPLQQGMKGTG